MNFEDMSDKAVLDELGRRVQRERLNRNMTQAGLALQAGVSRRTLQNLEAGRACSLAVLIRILRVLKKLEAVDAFLPEPGLSPVQLAKLKGRERMRASGAGHQRSGKES